MDRVLVPFDGSPPAERALRHAVEDREERVTVLSVVDPLSPEGCALSDAPLDVGGDLRADGGDSDLHAAERIVRETGGVADVRTVRRPGTPAATVVDYAEDNDVDAVVVGTSGRTGLRRLLFGSVAETVARRAPVPVTVVK
jgi:nucleotide-binding universal stress UspA family protein